MQSTKWVYEAVWVPKVKVIHWSKSLRFNIFKLLFLNNHLADWSQILCGVSSGWGNESLFKLFRSHDTRWPPCPYMVQSFKNLLLWNLKANDLETWYAASHTRVHATRFVHKMPQGWPWPILRQDQIWSCMLLCSKKIKQWIFQKLL